MGAPNVTYSITNNILSDEAGFNSIIVTFSASGEYTAFECRATPAAAQWGQGIGTLVAAFSQTPAGVERTFEVYDTDLVNGDGEYRISLYVQGTDGSWNDTILFIPQGQTSPLITSDGNQFLVRM